ncbi:MAG TPA: hypothetical protein VMU22_10955 [Rhizomicrobium sp.]|nr:hypothetical protein [Rhizomicrobium sp.]
MAEVTKSKVGQLLAAVPEAESELPRSERAERYRRLASEAFQLAEDCTDDSLRHGYLSLASGWHSLAFEIERSSHFQGA